MISTGPWVGNRRRGRFRGSSRYRSKRLLRKPLSKIHSFVDRISAGSLRIESGNPLEREIVLARSFSLARGLYRRFERLLLRAQSIVLGRQVRRLSRLRNAILFVGLLERRAWMLRRRIARKFGGFVRGKQREAAGPKETVFQ